VSKTGAGRQQPSPHVQGCQVRSARVQWRTGWSQWCTGWSQWCTGWSQWCTGWSQWCTGWSQWRTGWSQWRTGWSPLCTGRRLMALHGRMHHMTLKRPLQLSLPPGCQGVECPPNARRGVERPTPAGVLSAPCLARTWPVSNMLTR